MKILKQLAPSLIDVVSSSNPIAGTVLKMATKRLNMPEDSTPEQIEEEIQKEQVGRATQGRKTWSQYN